MDARLPCCVAAFLFVVGVPRYARAQSFDELLSQAAAGAPAAQYRLGEAYRTASGVQADPSRAVFWFKKAAAKCYAPAMAALGEMLHEGSGINPDDESAARYFRLASAQKNAAALYDWGMALMENRAFVDDAGADAKLAPQCKGDAAAVNTGTEPKGKETLFSSDPAKLRLLAVSVLRSAADLNEARAQYQLGRLYEFGTDVQRDLTQAISWYERAAKNGSADAEKRLYELKAAGRIH